MAKKHFEGTYYKCIANDGFSFALIQSVSSFSGPGLQLILENGSHEILQPDALRRVGDILHIEITQRNLFLSGTLAIKRKHPLSRPAMGPFRVFSMQCSHTVESMYHELWGEVNFNGTKHVFSPGRGYIEGDAGGSFPSQYFWYNAIGEDYGVTACLRDHSFRTHSFQGLARVYYGWGPRMPVLHLQRSQSRLRFQNPNRHREREIPLDREMGPFRRASVTSPAGWKDGTDDSRDPADPFFRGTP